MFSTSTRTAPLIPTPSIDDATPTDSWERALLDRQLEALSRLAEMGMDIAGAIHRRVLAAAAEPEAAPPTGAMLGVDRVARAVRLTFALQSRLIAEFKGKVAKPSAAAAEEPRDGPLEVFWLRPNRYDIARVKDAVRGAAQAQGHESEAVERLVREGGERLERDEIWSLVTTLPFDEIIALICKDVGLEKTPRPLDGVRAAPTGADRTVGSGGDGSAAVQPTGCPHPVRSPAFGDRSHSIHQGGREPWPP